MSTPVLAAPPGSSSSIPAILVSPESSARPVAEDDEEEAPPGLDKSVIMSVIQSHMSAVKHCYDKELRKDPELSGRLMVKFTVDPKGKVATADTDKSKSTLNNKEVERCIVGEVKSWIFPEPRGGISVDINYPFNFKPGA